MPFNINEIKGRLRDGGARPTLFNVVIAGPGLGLSIVDIPFMVQATDLPPSSVGSVDVPYFGRKIKVAGDRVYPEWTVTVLNDENFSVRSDMENWTNRINDPRANTRTGGSAPSAYKGTATVTQFGKDGSSLRSYIFEGIFPTEVSTIPLDWNTTDTIETFTVTFAYDLWTAV